MDYTKKQLNQANSRITELSSEIDRAKITMQEEIGTAISNYEAHITGLNDKLAQVEAESEARAS